MNSLPRIQDFGKAMKQFPSVASGQTKTNLTIFRLSRKSRQENPTLNILNSAEKSTVSTTLPFGDFRFPFPAGGNRPPPPVATACLPGQPRINSRSIETPPAKAQSSTSGATSKREEKFFYKRHSTCHRI